MEQTQRPLIKGRGAQSQPANRYLAHQLAHDFEQVADDQEYFNALDRPPTVYLPDDSQTIVSKNDSPDVGFRYSVNPYRGCAHRCSYCYARPTHEYLGLSAGLDFETKVMVKHRAPELFRDWLARPAWQPEIVAFSGVTDCYQPAERQYRLTRGCLEVAAECRQAIGIVTKNALVTRDLDVLRDMAGAGIVRVVLSITTLDSQLARVMEPRTSTPAARLRALEQLSSSGISTVVMIAPVIPGLSDSEMPAILRAARDAGAEGASYTLLRLPTTVGDVFFDWVDRQLPDQAEKIRSRIRATRDGGTNSAQFGRRMRGSGIMAEQISTVFQVFAKRYGLQRKLQPLDCTQFRPPRPTSGQRWLF